MSATAISVENLGKEYIIGSREKGGETFREMVVSAAATPFRRLKRLRGQSASEDRIWALKDVSFEVKQGEVVGIIGRNGAGKSTLLKILSRITEPTTGRATIRGRVSSLLEVGTGFHPELTGRENIYLNGAILGMSHAEIDRKFDEIVDFSGVERFLDTPIKRYSSGMSVRLAFAVAAHLEPEILIVDEVLAVGDAEFQRKCLGKMKDVAGRGRTVLFVSHNMGAISALCTEALLLEGGRRSFSGKVAEALDRYRGGVGSSLELTGRQIGMNVSLVKRTLVSGTAFSLQLDVRLIGPLNHPHLGVGINEPDGKRLATLISESQLPSVAEGKVLNFMMTSEPLRFAPDTLFSLRVALANAQGPVEEHEDLLRFVVPDYWPFPRPPHARPRGILFLDHTVQLVERSGF